jgi:hypothetical protein
MTRQQPRLTSNNNNNKRTNEQATKEMNGSESRGRE